VSEKRWTSTSTFYQCSVQSLAGIERNLAE
jgi:hypothetical protein